MKQAFIEKRFTNASLALISLANEIIEEYQAQGYSLTLRQLYYQFVARGLIENTMRSYKRLGSVINDGRLTGHIDWDAIEDRTRNLKKNLHLDSPKDAVQVIRNQYGIDMWENQDTRVEVWIEKEALIGVIERVCRKNDVPFFACRGYVSQSEQWRAFRRHASTTQRTIILHLGDHDPSGIDMTRDNQDRLNLFHGWPGATDVQRIALTMDQVEEFEPPPNPAKMTDSRFEDYRLNFGDLSWELDALEPSMMESLIQNHINIFRDDTLWGEKVMQRDDELDTLDNIISEL